MIKRYILHIEAHRNVFRYRPRISFKRAPRHGDRVVDGGVPGTLKLCPECQEGFLHEPDPIWKRARAQKPTTTPLAGLLVESLVRNLASQAVTPPSTTRSPHRSRPAMDFNVPTHVELTVDEPKAPKPPQGPTHVELKEKGPEHVELKLDEEVERPEDLEFEDGSPEELKLNYALGTVDHKRGDVLWTHKAEYVVDKLEDDILYLVRKDVWDEREKKAKHVKLNLVEDESEHVEVKAEEGTVVKLKFD